MSGWYFSPQTGGTKIPSEIHAKITAQANAYANTRPWSEKFQLQLRFKSQFCYLDILEKDGTISPIGRLRYFQPDRWSLAFYTYSSNRYQPCVFATGEWFGTIEKAIDVCEVYMI